METAAVSLKDVFRIRIDRAARALENPSAGPKIIYFSSDELSNTEKLEKLHAKFPNEKQGTTYLYQLSIDGDKCAHTRKARAAFRQVREKKKYNMSRDNYKHPDTDSLYVGTSGDLHARFRTHLGRGTGKTTWSLYLSKWAAQLNMQFVVKYYELTETASEDVELIEGILWDSLLPLFGKKGGK